MVIDPPHVPIRPMKEEDVDAVALIDSMYVGAHRAEYCSGKPGSGSERARINTSLVAEARASISQLRCKG